MSADAPGYFRIQHIIGDRKRGIEPIIPVSKSTWWSWVAEGKAPAPIKLGSRTTVWRKADIYAFAEALGTEAA